jgi:hypothetical protein
MIYKTLSPNNLEQGDICSNLPRISPIDIDFNSQKELWLNTIKKINKRQFQDKIIQFKIEPSRVDGVILSQSCDIRSGFSILFAELYELPENKLSPKLGKRIKGIKKIVRDETRAHYFPPDKNIKFFDKPKLLDFKSLFLIPFNFLNNHLDDFFIARLKKGAQEVLRDKIMRFFTRFAFEDIMFLNQKELAQFINENPNNEDEIHKKIKDLGREIPDLK